MKNTKFAFIVLTLLFSFMAFGQGTALPQMNQWVLDSIKEMPAKGGYELTSSPVKKMRDAFTWSSDQLKVNAASAVPSYCTTATYIVFFKALEKYWGWASTSAQRESLVLIKPNLDNDGARIWGRWNSNGPGTSKFFNDADLGRNFDDINDALPGDFLKMWWNEHVGKKERGHSVIYLGRSVQNGVPMITFWGSNASTSGYGIKTIPAKDAIRTLFSRLEKPENIDNLMQIPVNDQFLASMLTVESSWWEVRRVTGIE